jgi:hypothetical protein
MIQRLLGFLFPCSHRYRSWPQVRNGKAYQACLDCGREIPYKNKELISA